ncbi:ulp1 protease family protein [Cladophialophora carrionii]|uniref:Ulp1 protease family protein n=1 Tax=Cladophialophora carrionii TaxID=86049 RepID=A0A1C1CDC9_9EURO|nr:ulp1 protease family protein [Cladophialophora carrionii]
MLVPLRLRRSPPATLNLPGLLEECWAKWAVIPTVTREDISVLKNDWLTDNVIAFWEEYLEREYLTNYKHSHIVLLRPTMSFMLMQTPDPRTIKDALPDFTNVTHIFLPINDNPTASVAEGGTHWSLLLVSIVDGVAFHYDSMPPGNQHEAHYATQKLSRLINRPLRFINLSDSPLQDNGSDCGVFVCLNMRHLLLKRLLMVRTDNKVSMSLGGRTVDAAAGRKEMLKIIDEFRREGERRRSISNSPHPGRKSRSPPRIDSPGANRSKSPRHG